MTHSEYITGSNKSPTTNRLSPSELSYDSEDSSTSPSTLTTSTGTSSSKKKPNLRIDIGSNKTVPLAHVPNNNSPFTKQQSTMNPSNVVNQLETLIGSKNVKHTTASENTPTIDKFHNKGRQQQVSIKGFMRPNLYEEDVYDFLSEYPVRSRSVSPPPTTSLFSHHHKKKTPMSTEKKSPSVLVQAVGTKTPTSVKSKDEEDTDDNCVTPPQRKSFSRDDGISDDEEVDSDYVTPPSDIRTVSITEPQTDNFRLIRQPFLPFNDLSSPLSMMRKCQTPVAVKTKAETLSSSFGHIKFYERRRKRYLMMITDKDSSVMEDELNLLREDFIEAKTNIMRRNRKIDQMTFSDMVYTEQFDKNPTSEDDSFESCTQDQTIFLGKKSYEKIARFLTSKMMISLDQLHTDLKAFIIELEEAAALQFPSLSEDSFVLEMKEIAHRIIEAGLSELIKQVYMKDLNDLLVSLRDLHAEADEQDLPRINFSLKELKKLLFIYSRVNRIIAVYNRIPEHLKVLNLPQARKRSGSEAKGIPRVNTPPVTELAHLKKLSLNLDSTLAKKSGSSIDLLHNPSTADKQNLQITNLLKKWQEESTVITPRSEQSTMSSPTHTTSSSVTSTPKSPQDTLFCRYVKNLLMLTLLKSIPNHVLDLMN
ncbi:hypothetical protein C9374_007463 [Naegleria lovaniensis]|uniref:Uncharacterized protein n=1 Tax=Naegleria lovaniensis TaxID=51637 RepID=A0AA88GKS7_NAELO|nr:uncharacterized protein C9374_007463 [Naegleria lovaniensis]KAG2379324.1 hypothetical protein C9374_007463 [Naegleria lovaniensis]